MVPVIRVLSLLVSANLFAAFLCIIFRRGFLLDDSHADQFDAVCGVWSWALTGWFPQPPTPSTSAAMLAALICLFPKHNLWIWRWARATQLLWSTMARPVLSGNCPVKSLYGLGYLAAAQFQGFLRHLYVEQFFFSRSSESSLLWGAMLNFQWPVWESENDSTKFNTPATPSQPETL